MTHYYSPFSEDPNDSPDELITLWGLIPVSKLRSGVRRKVIRTVQNDRVRIFGYDFAPDCLAHGRFDGRRYVFLLTPVIAHNGSIWYSAYIRMLHSGGMELRARSTTDDDLMYNEDDEMLWNWWYVVEE